ncbi:MAG: hypothetical protein KatS3mg064_0821 [Tepidiforma sp.]|nr:DUF192 domain-containing protein [Tepidiforma sp.]GIW17664.1 MAG: hypothetical protein KatS3mg064_0821 [Tepidiforma sp.]
MARTVRVVNTRTGNVVADRVAVADSFWSRFRGLMLRRTLEPGEGLLIQPCSSIHMLFMRFAIDAVFMDGDGRVLRVARRVRPWVGLAAARGARAVIELPAGAAEELAGGDLLRFEPV